MRNAKDEFIAHISGKQVLCCEIIILDKERIELTTGWIDTEWDEFLKKIDVEYDSGYGGQELYGNIWYKDDTWSSRSEYDGSEWWKHNTCPTIPDYLNRVDKVRDEKLNKIIN